MNYLNIIVHAAIRFFLNIKAEKISVSD
jgi:hypothetical protein